MRESQDKTVDSAKPWECWGILRPARRRALNRDTCRAKCYRAVKFCAVVIPVCDEHISEMIAELDAKGIAHEIVEHARYREPRPMGV